MLRYKAIIGGVLLLAACQTRVELVTSAPSAGRDEPEIKRERRTPAASPSSRQSSLSSPLPPSGSPSSTPSLPSSNRSGSPRPSPSVRNTPQAPARVETESPSTVSAQGFVSVRDQKFMLDGKPFFFAGANAAWLLQKRAERDENYTGVPRFMALAKKMGITVIRTWAYSEGYKLQTSLGKFDENGFKALDSVLKEAAEQNLKVILTLVDYQGHDYVGGMDNYIEWLNLLGPKKEKNIYAFYTHPKAIAAFKQTIRKILERKNTYTQVAYKDDPTIFAWEIANEARNGTFGLGKRSYTGADNTGATLEAWYKDIGTYIKSIDKKHLVATGEEGHEVEPYTGYTPSAYNLAAGSLYPFQSGEGSSFRRNTKLDCIDFASIHVYENYFTNGNQIKDYVHNADLWMKDHLLEAKKLGKPLVLGEFGWEGESDHEVMVTGLLGSCLKHKIHGCMVWGLRPRELSEVSESFGFPVPESFDSYPPAVQFRDLAEKIAKLK